MTLRRVLIATSVSELLTRLGRKPDQPSIVALVPEIKDMAQSYTVLARRSNGTIISSSSAGNNTEEQKASSNLLLSEVGETILPGGGTGVEDREGESVD